jgi:hypothetical protein
MLRQAAAGRAAARPAGAKSRTEAPERAIGDRAPPGDDAGRPGAAIGSRHCPTAQIQARPRRAVAGKTQKTAKSADTSVEESYTFGHFNGVFELTGTARSSSVIA